MKPDNLKKIAKVIYPNEIVEIEDDEVWLVNYPPTTADNSGRKVLATQFNPKEDTYQLADCEEWLLSKYFAVEINKFISNYTARLSKVGSFGFSDGKTKAEALLNTTIKVIGREER